MSVFLLSLTLSADSDLGWHLKYGEYFIKTGKVLRDNIFSLEMPDYKWVNSSWLTDPITYLIFSNGQFLALAIAGGLTVAAIFYFLSKAFRFSFWEKTFIFPLLLMVNGPLTRVSFRGQLISLMFVALLLYVLNEYKSGRKNFIYLTIPLFLLWANLHGGFLLGLAIMGIYLAVNQAMRIRNIDKKLLAVVPAAIISTLVNPFGAGIYLESFRHFGNEYQKYIIEWIPLAPFTDLWWILIFWGIFLAINIHTAFSRGKFRENAEIIFLSTVLYFMSHWMRRYAWTMYLLSVPLAALFFKYTFEANYQIRKTLPVIIWTVIYLFAVFYHIPQKSLPQMSWDRLCAESIKCSAASAKFLSENKFPGRMLTNYNWGGWLIWNYPEVKPSIDGRMHLWKDESGYSSFAEYYFLEQNINDIDKTNIDVVYMSTEKPLHARMIELVNQGKWKVVYGDDFAGVFVRNK